MTLSVNWQAFAADPKQRRTTHNTGNYTSAAILGP